MKEVLQDGIFIYPETDLNIRRFRDVPKNGVAIDTKEKVIEKDNRLDFLDPRMDKNVLLGFKKETPQPRFIEKLKNSPYVGLITEQQYTPKTANSFDVIPHEKKEVTLPANFTTEVKAAPKKEITGISTAVSGFIPTSDSIKNEDEETEKPSSSKKMYWIIGASILVISIVIVLIFKRK